MCPPVEEDEAIDLRDDVAKLLAFENDRIFRFVLDGHEFKWGGPFITGATLPRLRGLDVDAYSVTQRSPEGDRQLHLSELVDIGAPGVENFTTAPADKARA